MDWLSGIGDFFNAVTSPIDTLVAFLVQIAFEALSWVLGKIIEIMKLTDSFADVQVTKDMVFLVNTAMTILSFGVATYYVFAVLLDYATGSEGETPSRVFGKFLHYGFRLLAMPVFLLTALKLNSIFIDAIQILGLNPKKMIADFKLSGKDPGDFIVATGKLFAVSQSSILISSLFALVLAIVFVVLLYQLVRRTGDVFFLYVFMAPVALTVLTKDLDMYSTWWRQLISVVVGQSVQVIGIYSGIQMIIEEHGIIGLGILFATIGTPALLKEFAYNSGGSGIVRQGTSALIFSLAK